MLRLIEGQDVDLIEPFPLAEVRRLVGWTHCFRTTFIPDGVPKDEKSLIEFYSNSLAAARSWGVIDKNNNLGYRHEAPLIGCFILEHPANLSNGYLHITSTRKAWGSGLLAEAAKLVIEAAFATEANLLRLSSMIITSNAPAKQFIKSLGFRQDGQLKDYITQNGVPKAISHFGLLKNQPSQENLHEGSKTSEPVSVTVS